MTYFVGIDIAKFKHDCFIMNEQGEIIRNSFSFSNNSSGFKELLDTLKSLDSLDIRIGFEATAHYGMNLKLFLESNGFSYMEFNPLLIERFSKSSSLRRTKTDKKDASLIAFYLSNVPYKPYQSKSYQIYSLKSLTRSRDKLIKQRSIYLVKITNCLDLIFPEFKSFFGNSLKSASVMYLLHNYPSPKKIANMNIESYHKMIDKLHNRKFSYAKFLKLRELAKNTVGISNDILEFELYSFLELYKQINSQIIQYEDKITQIMKEFDYKTSTIPGIGIISAASIVSEFGGDFSKFKSPNQMLAYAGLEPSTIQSGTMLSYGKMVKHGSGYLRETLMNVTMTCIVQCPQFYDYYLKKRSEGKSHRVALSHLCRKLIRIIFHLETTNSNFSLSRVN